MTIFTDISAITLYYIRIDFGDSLGDSRLDDACDNMMFDLLDIEPLRLMKCKKKKKKKKKQYVALLHYQSSTVLKCHWMIDNYISSTG